MIPLRHNLPTDPFRPFDRLVLLAGGLGIALLREIRSCQQVSFDQRPDLGHGDATPKSLWPAPQFPARPIPAAIRSRA